VFDKRSLKKNPRLGMRDGPNFVQLLSVSAPLVIILLDKKLLFSWNSSAISVLHPSAYLLRKKKVWRQRKLFTS